MKLSDAMTGVFLIILAVIISIPIASGLRSLSVPIVP